MWIERLGDEPAVRQAIDDQWPYALGIVGAELRPELTRRVAEKLGREPPGAEPVERGDHVPELEALWQEMTMVRRSAPAGAQW